MYSLHPAYAPPPTFGIQHHFPIFQLVYSPELPSPPPSPKALDPKAPEFLPNISTYYYVPENDPHCFFYSPQYSHHVCSSSNPCFLHYHTPPVSPAVEDDGENKIGRARSSLRQQRIRNHQKIKTKENGNFDCGRPLVWKQERKRPPMNIVHANAETFQRDDENTTLMIRNVPNKYTRAMLVSFLDEYCKKENEKSETDEYTNDDVPSSYDFVYLPIDFMTGCNKGYAFVNFTDASSACKFKQGSHNTNWEYFHSNKIRQIVPAKIQGKEALVKHFQMSSFACSSDEFLPACFNPGRDGSGTEVTQQIVGKRNMESDMVCSAAGQVANAVMGQ